MYAVRASLAYVYEKDALYTMPRKKCTVSRLTGG
jgi:hypothetical protein